MAIETLQALSLQANLNSQEYSAYSDNNSHFPVWRSLHEERQKETTKNIAYDLIYDFIFQISHSCGHVGRMSHSEKVFYLYEVIIQCIRPPHTVIWTAAVGKVHRLFLPSCFQHQRVFAKTVLIIIMSSTYTLSDDVCLRI